MLDQLKQFALSKLSEQMAPNSLDENKTKEAAEEGTNSIMGFITDNLGSGAMDKITSIFSGKSDAKEDGFVDGLIGKFKDMFTGKGMDEKEAEAEAENNVMGILGGLKDKFLSKDDKDKDFDLENITSLIGGGEKGGIMDKIKGLF